MSFSKSILNYSQNLQHWTQDILLERQAQNLQNTDASAATKHTQYNRYKVAMPEATVEVGIQPNSLMYFAVISGNVTNMEKACFESISDYLVKFKTVPTLRELDFFLRDKPQVPAWPINFNTDFLKATLDIFAQNSIQHFSTPIEWLRAQLASNNKLTIQELTGDKILVEGSKQDAWAIEKNFDEWQETLRTTFQRPQLVLLFAINF